MGKKAVTKPHSIATNIYYHYYSMTVLAHPANQHCSRNLCPLCWVLLHFLFHGCMEVEPHVLKPNKADIQGSKPWKSPLILNSLQI